MRRVLQKGKITLFAKMKFSTLPLSRNEESVERPDSKVDPVFLPVTTESAKEGNQELMF
jgi:hypothetical protein